MRFLPMEISGVLVLSRTGAEQQREAEIRGWKALEEYAKLLAVSEEKSDGG